MTTDELIAILEDEGNPNVLDYIDDAVEHLKAQQQRIAELEAEFANERHRHDRYVDFELAQAQKLENALADLKKLSQYEADPCSLCAHGCSPEQMEEMDYDCLHSCPTPCPCKGCGSGNENWEWRGVHQEDQV